MRYLNGMRCRRTPPTHSLSGRFSQPHTTASRAKPVTPVTDRLPDCSTVVWGREPGHTAVAQPIIWKEITTAFEGRAIGGSRAVEDGHVRVRTALGEKSAPLEEANGVWVGLAPVARDGGGGKGVTQATVNRRNLNFKPD
jgi:hypothetical protein